jgi:hypothetical protein
MGGQGVPALRWVLSQKVEMLSGVLGPQGQSVVAEVALWALFYLVYSQSLSRFLRWYLRECR